MSRKRKPIIKTLASATEEVVWRARILCEILDGRENDSPTIGAVRNLEHALEGYEASRNSTNGHAQLELQP